MSPLYLYGLHGTSLEAAERILAHGWDVRAAAALATPRLRTGPRWVYAYWGEDLQVLMASRLWAAQQWAVEAVERPHAHAWAERPLFCEMCAREPELAWEEA